MKNRIELVLAIRVSIKVVGEESLFVAVYEREKKGRSQFNLTTCIDGNNLKHRFYGLDDYKSIQTENVWVRSWSGVYKRLEEYSWTGGYPVFCHPDHAEAILQAYECRHGYFQETWFDKLGFVPDDSNS